MSGLSERDVERLAEALCRSGCINYDPDVQGGCSLCTEAVEGYQAPVVAAIRDEAKAEALREMSQKFRTEAAEVWGANISWLTTGRKVADLVSFWCDDEADRIGGDQ